MKARLSPRPIETRVADDAPFRYWGPALVLAAAGAWTLVLGAVWLSRALI